MQISVVIPNYNGEELLKKNLSKVVGVLSAAGKQTKHRLELIIIDDSSTDKSVAFLTSCIDSLGSNGLSIKLITNEKNLGFSPTINKAVKKAHGEIIYLLNSDVLPEKDFLEPLLTHFTDTNVFAVGSMDKSVEDGDVVLRGRGIGKWQRGFFVHQRGEVDKTNTLWVNGGSGAYRRATWEKLGGFCELYKPYYYEDIDLSYRAQKAGYKVTFEPKSIVIHEHDIGAIKKTQTERKIKQIAYRNQFLFVWINITDIGFLFEHFVWLPYHFLKSFMQNDMSFLSGFFAAVVLLPQVMMQRIRLKKYHTISDRKIFSGYLHEK